LTGAPRCATDIVTLRTLALRTLPLVTARTFRHQLLPSAQQGSHRIGAEVKGPAWAWRRRRERAKMGGALSSLGKQKLNVLVVGLDNSGKTTIINSIKPSKFTTQEVVPTVGFQVEQFSKAGLNFTMFDMSGAGKYRSLWESYYKDTEAIIFVIDSADELRMTVVKDELNSLLMHKDLPSGVPVLFFANKKDLPTSMPPGHCAQVLQLEEIQDRPWQIWHCNALTGEGVDDGFAWLADTVRKRRTK